MLVKCTLYPSQYGQSCSLNFHFEFPRQAPLCVGACVWESERRTHIIFSSETIKRDGGQPHWKCLLKSNWRNRDTIMWHRRAYSSYLFIIYLVSCAYGAHRHAKINMFKSESISSSLSLSLFAALLSLYPSGKLYSQTSDNIYLWVVYGLTAASCRVSCASDDEMTFLALQNDDRRSTKQPHTAPMPHTCVEQNKNSFHFNRSRVPIKTERSIFVQMKFRCNYSLLNSNQFH